MPLNIQIFQQTNDRKEKKNEREKAKVVRKRHTHLHPKRKPKEDLKQSSQNRYNSHFNLNKQAYAQCEAALQKEQRMPKATL
jgi:hypothetical protein